MQYPRSVKAQVSVKMLISYKRDTAIFFLRMKLCKAGDADSIHTYIFPESVVPVKTEGRRD